MLLYLRNAIASSGNTDYDFFRSAYLHVYGKVNNSDTDVVQYILHGLIPQYVISYIHHLQRS